MSVRRRNQASTSRTLSPLPAVSLAGMKVGDEGDRVGVGRGPGQGQSQLAGVDGAAAPRPGVGRDRLGLDPDPAHDRVGVFWPTGRGVVNRGDLRAGHALRVDPLGLTDGGVGAPHRGVAFGRDREITPLLDRGLGEVGGEVAGIGADPQPVGLRGCSAHLFGDPGQPTAQHRRGAGPDVVVAGQQIRGGGHARFGPGRQVWTTGSLSGVVVGHALLARPVDLHVGGVQVDGDPAAQPGPAVNWEELDGASDQVGGRGLDPGHLLGTEAAGQSTRRGRGQTRHRRQLRSSHVLTLPVERHQGVAAQQL